MLFNLSHLISFEDVTSTHEGIAKGFDQGKGMAEELMDEMLQKGVSVREEFLCVVARKPL